MFTAIDLVENRLLQSEEVPSGRPGMRVSAIELWFGSNSENGIPKPSLGWIYTTHRTLNPEKYSNCVRLSTKFPINNVGKRKRRRACRERQGHLGCPIGLNRIAVRLPSRLHEIFPIHRGLGAASGSFLPFHG